MSARPLTLRRTALAVACLGLQFASAAESATRSSPPPPKGPATPAAAGPDGARPVAAPLASSDRDAGLSPLTAAQRDFNAMQAARETSGFPRRTLPAIAAPELPNSDPLPPSSGVRALRPPAKDMTSPTWLLDAMQKRAATDPRSASVSDGARSRGLPSLAAAGRSLDPVSEGRDAAAGGSAPDRPSSPSTTTSLAAEKRNPLTPFLADWMTPQDYTLLKPGISGALERRHESTEPYGSPSIQGVTIDPAMATAATARPLTRGGVPPVTPAAGGPRSTTAQENPFLKALESPTGSLTTIARAISPPPSVSTPVIAPIAPVSNPPTSAPTSRVPDFVKPATDEKYFKPLKRF